MRRLVTATHHLHNRQVTGRPRFRLKKLDMVVVRISFFDSTPLRLPPASGYMSNSAEPIVASPGGAGPGFNAAPPQQYEPVPNPRSSTTPSNTQMAGSGQRRDRDSVDRHHPADRHRAPRH